MPLLLWNIFDVLEDIDCACCRSKRATEITAFPCATSEFQSNPDRVSWPTQRMIDYHIHVRSCQPTSAQSHRQVSGSQACPNAFLTFAKVFKIGRNTTIPAAQMIGIAGLIVAHRRPGPWTSALSQSPNPSTPLPPWWGG